MPRVVPNQKDKFENDELFRKLSRESEIRYTGHRDKPLSERQLRFRSQCFEGQADIAFVSCGINLQLIFIPSLCDKFDEKIDHQEFVNFELEPGKVHLKSRFIMNGVCVVWRGWIDLLRLDGTGRLEFDEDSARIEDKFLRERGDQYALKMAHFDEIRQRCRQSRDHNSGEKKVKLKIRKCPDVTPMTSSKSHSIKSSTLKSTK